MGEMGGGRGGWGGGAQDSCNRLGWRNRLRVLVFAFLASGVGVQSKRLIWELARPPFFREAASGM